MRDSLEENVLQKLLKEGAISREMSLLAIGAGPSEAELFRRMGFKNVTLTNLDPRVTADGEWRVESQDAQALSYPDRSFDLGFVSDVVHHCSSPHRAIVELYRVAKVGVVVIESRDSALMRVAGALKAVPTHELYAVVYDENHRGGVDNTVVPNFIYRWTEREFEKTIRSFDPTGPQEFRYFYRLSLPETVSAKKGEFLRVALISLLRPFVRVLQPLLRTQGNRMAMIAFRPKNLFAWLSDRNGTLDLNESYVKSHF